MNKRYFIKLLSNIINGFINVVLVAIVPKALGTVAYGEFSYLFQFFSRLFGLLDAGSSTAFFTKLSANLNRKNLIGYYFILSAIILGISLAFVFLSQNYYNKIFPDIHEEYILLGLFFGFLTWFLIFFIKISDSFALTVSIEIIRIIYKITSAVTLVILINWFYFDLTVYFLFNIFSMAIFLIALSIFFIKRKIFSKEIFQNINFKATSKEFLEYSLPLFIGNIFSVAIYFYQIWLLQKFGGSEETGFYGLAYQIAAMSFLFTSAMTQILMREFSKAYGENNFDELRNMFQTYIPMLYSVTAFFALFLLFQAENIVHIFTNKDFEPAIPVIMIMSFYPLHQTYGQLSSSLLFATGKTKLYRNLSFVSQTLSFIISTILVYFYNLGAIGFAITMVVVQFIGTNLQLIFNTKYLKISYFKMFFHQIYSVGFIITVSFFSTKIINTEDLIKHFLISGVIYTIIILISTCFFQQIFIKINLCKEIKKLIK